MARRLVREDRRLKPQTFCGTYGATEAAPFQNKSKQNKFKLTN
jgi:hypothetical protein